MFAHARSNAEADLRRVIEADNVGDRAPEILGPVRSRGAPSGLILADGRFIASWGPTSRIDMAFSVSKNLLSSVAGLAYDRGLLPDLHEPVRETLAQTDGLELESDHNREITWHHLLQQTSLWRGRLWGKPHDAHGAATPDGAGPPGSAWTYTDTRVNVLALALTRLWGRGLPDVVSAGLMWPIGANHWEWHSYPGARVDINGAATPVVSGGGRWGAGLWISTESLARYGELHRLGGCWQGRQLVSDAWLTRALTPCAHQSTYGYLWWLNTGRLLFPSMPEGGFAAIGFGLNLLWVDPGSGRTVVVRWLGADGTDLALADGFLARVYAALGD